MLKGDYTMSDKNEVSNVVRSSKGLQDVLFDEMDSVRNGSTTPQSARAVVAIANGIISSARLEMDHARFISSQRAEPGDGFVASAQPVLLGTQHA